METSPVELPKYTSNSKAKEDPKDPQKALLSENLERLDTFASKPKYTLKSMFDMDQLEGSVLLKIPDQKDKNFKKTQVIEKPRVVPLVADRKNYEKTKHVASSDIFEFAIAQDSALSKAFSADYKKSSRSLFSEFDVSEEVLNSNKKLKAEADPAYDKEGLHNLPAVLGKNHYNKFGLTGFVPCSDQSRLPNPQYTRVLSCSLWVGNLPPSATEEDLKKEFEVFGEVKSLDIMPNSSYSFVRFGERKVAEEALRGWHGVWPKLLGVREEEIGKVQRNEKPRVRWAKGNGIFKDNFSWMDGVSYVATADIAHLGLTSESLQQYPKVEEVLREGERVSAIKPKRESPGNYARRKERTYSAERREILYGSRREDRKRRRPKYCRRARK